MKNDIIMYEQIYQVLKNKIENGRLKEGTSLPSRKHLCDEFHTSEKTIRKVLALLKDDGLISCEQRKRPIVSKRRGNHALDKCKKASAEIANDIMKSGIILCYPVNERGMNLCREKGLEIAEEIVKAMNPMDAKQFWKDSNRLWRFFICRCENDLILRILINLGFTDIEPLPGTYEQRQRYHLSLQALLRVIRDGGDYASVEFEDVSEIFGFMQSEEFQTWYLVSPDSLLYNGVDGLEKKICKGEDRSAIVYMDLLGLMISKHYTYGEQLPSTIELHTHYNVSVKTASNAIQQLQQWGAVKAIRGKGIFVAMEQEQLMQIALPKEQIAHQVRRFLDSFELLTLTIRKTAEIAGIACRKKEIPQKLKELEIMWNDYQIYHMSSRYLLNFIVNNIPYDALRAIYSLLLRNFRIGRCIPCFVNTNPTTYNRMVHLDVIKAFEALSTGDSQAFSNACKQLFQKLYTLSIQAFVDLDYYEEAMHVYDGSILWK